MDPLIEFSASRQRDSIRALLSMLHAKLHFKIPLRLCAIAGCPALCFGWHGSCDR